MKLSSLRSVIRSVVASSGGKVSLNSEARRRSRAVLITIALIVNFYSVLAISNEDSRSSKPGEKITPVSSEEYRRRQDEAHEKMVELLPQAINQLQSETDLSQRIDVIRALGNSENEAAITPLRQILENKNESRRTKNAALNSLLEVSSSHFYRTLELNKRVEKEVIPSLEDLFQRSDESFRSDMADILYRMGKKGLAIPYLKARLRQGDWGPLNTFLFYGYEGPIMRSGTFPEAPEKQRVDPDALPILKEIVTSDYPTRIKIDAASILIHDTENKETPFQFLVTAVRNQSEKQFRMQALSLLRYIGDEKSKQVLRDMTNDPQLGFSARAMLKKLEQK